MSKSPLSFQPAPRPQPRVSPEDARRLQEATQDLGFGRPTSTPAPAPAVVAEPVAAPALVATPVIAPAPAAAPSPIPAADPAKRNPALKFDVPEALWNELRIAAIQRRVTVKFLVMEALAAKGYAVDLSAVPEDGRRIR